MSGWLPLTIANIDLKAEKLLWKAEKERLEHAIEVLEDAFTEETQRLRKAIEILEDELYRVSAERDEAEAERDEFGETCEFYANDLSWKLKSVPGYKTEVSDAEMDLGMRAKRALGEQP